VQYKSAADSHENRRKHLEVRRLIVGIRIIAGKYKGATIDAPDSARPTLSRHRQSLFDILSSLESSSGEENFFHDKIVVDCFAGSGALGFEALSRGAKYAYFIDNNKKAISVLRANALKINANESCVVICEDASKIFVNNSEICDLAFLDPPYNSAEINIVRTVERLLTARWISKNTILVVETAGKRPLDNLLFNEHDYDIITSRRLGNSTFTIAKLR
jgi:16S rRNA (guanine966-N2)-methyltransferase